MQMKIQYELTFPGDLGVFDAEPEMLQVSGRIRCKCCNNKTEGPVRWRKVYPNQRAIPYWLECYSVEEANDLVKKYARSLKRKDGFLFVQVRNELEALSIYHVKNSMLDFCESYISRIKSLKLITDV